jgi:acyl carrier protein
VGRVPHLVNSTGDIVPRLAAWVATAGDAQVSGDRHPRPPLATPFVEPADEIESGVAEVWQDIMGLEEVGVLDSFFELGGHSLMAVQLIGRIRKVFKVNLPLSALAEAPTVRDLSATIGLLIEQRSEHREAAPDEELDLADSTASAMDVEADEVLLEESA